MKIQDEFSLKIQDFQKLPKNASQNLTKSGKRRPMTYYVASVLHDKKLNIRTFQRTASVYYKTQRIGRKLWLTNQINNYTIVINFTTDSFNYIKIQIVRNSETSLVLQIPKPKYNSDLFKKIVNKKLL